MTQAALVLVHGRDQGGKNENALKSTWLGALKEGLGSRRAKRLDEVDLRFPFYADVLDKLTAEIKAAIPADIMTKGDGSNVDADFLVFEQLVLEQIAHEAGLSDKDIRSELPPDAQEKGPGSWQWVQAILRALDRIPGVSAATIERTTRDVYAYLTRNNVRKAVNAIVEPALRGRCVVVGHSLGSIVTYYILKNLKKASEVPLYCTVGSPLAITGVRENLMPLVFPKGVSVWFNAFDKRDLVALNPLDKKRYPLKPPIVNDSSIKNATDNHHGIIEYLNKKPVADRIFAALFP
jgi:hypothetical protein